MWCEGWGRVPVLVPSLLSSDTDPLETTVTPPGTIESVDGVFLPPIVPETTETSWTFAPCPISDRFVYEANSPDAG